MTEKRVALMFGDPAKLPPYEAALRLASAEPVLNPENIEDIEGLVLAGGTDVNPLRYGAEPHPKTEPPDDNRDERELRLLQEALQRNIPVLAICRGMQLFNVAHGGTLIQHLEGNTHVQRGVPDAHKIAIEPASTLAAIIAQPEYPVNSRHHQAVDRIGSGLRVAARSSDGVIEALENASCQFALAVQWHPEDRCATHDGDRYLFEAFVRAITENRR
jgi:putative glutamine amidotransferase